MSLILSISEYSSSEIGSSGGGGGGTLATPVLTATSPSSTEIDLSCTAVAGASAYIFEQSPDNSAWTVIQNSSARTKNVTGLASGTYYFRVKAHGLESADSTYYTVTASTNESWTGTQVTFEGDSITNGVGASDSAHRWTSLLSALRGNTERNRGFNSETMQDNGCSYPEFAGTFSKAAGDKYLFMALGVNDVGVNTSSMTPANFQTTYQGWITTILGMGWSASDLVLLTPYYINGYSNYVGGCGVSTPADVTRHEQYVQKVKDLALANHCILADIYTYMKNTVGIDSMLSDGVHPNDTGHALIADFLNNLNYTPQ
jgi:lysophospholipase L1-like esterase